ncbi:hypothetical protein [Mediannikoviicoccus vaginalis]|uniref:hypothetical protein n=1 Tax=Mediannikoviicoccus vaginalis TaxID=2899727 RepID=UPI001F3A12EB|nr:hypothetical protein [Mediannikoviicoccus vaginalis]
MRRFINFIKDTIYDLNHFVFTLLIIVAVAFILQNRIRFMFSRDYSKIGGNEVKAAENVEREALYNEDNMPDIDISVLLPEDSSPEDVARILNESNVVEDIEGFLNIINTYNLQEKIKYGDYEIKKGSTMEEVVNQITDNALDEAKKN